MIQISEERLKELMIEAVKEANAASCPLSHSSREEVGHLFGRFKDIGQGNLSVGIERATKAMEWIASIREFGSKIGGKAAIIIVLGGISFVSAIMGKGLLSWLKDLLK